MFDRAEYRRLSCPSSAAGVAGEALGVDFFSENKPLDFFVAADDTGAAQKYVRNGIAEGRLANPLFAFLKGDRQCFLTVRSMWK